MTKWDLRYLTVAQLVSSWSKDPEVKVGCVLVNGKNRIIATGFNGPPAHMDNLKAEDRLAVTVHAEINALLSATDIADTAYVWPVAPCSQCMAALAQAGIKRVVTPELCSSKWRPDITKAVCKELLISLVITRPAETSE